MSTEASANSFSPAKIEVWNALTHLHYHENGPLASTVGDLDISSGRSNSSFPGSAPGLSVRARPRKRVVDGEGDNCYVLWIEVDGAYVDLGHLPHRIFISGYTDEVCISERVEKGDYENFLFTPKPLPRAKGKIVIVIEPGVDDGEQTA